MHGAAEPQRPEHAEHEPVHVKQRQAVGQHVVAGPLPGLGQRVQVGGDRAARQQHALRRAGRARRVDHERRRLGVGFARQRLIGTAQLHVEALELIQRRRQFGAGCGQHQARLAVVDDVPELTLAGLRVDRDHGNSRGQCADHRYARLQRRCRPYRNAFAAGEPLCKLRGHVAELSVGECALAEADGLLVAGAFQRCQQRRDLRLHRCGHSGASRRRPSRASGSSNSPITKKIAVSDRDYAQADRIVHRSDCRTSGPRRRDGRRSSANANPPARASVG